MSRSMLRFISQALKLNFLHQIGAKDHNKPANALPQFNCKVWACDVKTAGIILAFLSSKCYY